MTCHLPKPDETLRSYSERHARTSNRQIIHHQKLWRLKEIEKTVNQTIIETHHIHHLDRIARFTIASEHYSKCSTEAQLLLLHDEHHFVRSAAQIANYKKKVINPFTPLKGPAT
ncbi:hypothetical protein ACP3V3_16870 [Vibrio sp. PNB22_3_1]